jgi:DNA topoisomerase-6 subunit B
VVNQQVTYTEISPSEFFYRNRDLAGFTNPARALYSATRELVENSLDACELFGIVPDIQTRIITMDLDNKKSDPKPYVVRVHDNGPGLDPKHVPNAFAKIFFGSKFRLRQSRGMFGMGGTMAILYGQITTGKPVTITTSTDGVTAYSFDLLIDIQSNTPLIMRKNTQPASGISGTSVEIILQGDYIRAAQKIQDYFRQAALVTPYANMLFIDPQGHLFSYERATDKMPNPPLETLPHPYGIDTEALRRLLKQAKEDKLIKFMYRNFHRVGERIGRKFLEYVKLDADRDPKTLSNEEILTLSEALHNYREFLQPDAACLSPLGEDLLSTGIKKELQPEFFAVVSRPPSAYSGYPFIVEAGLVYGGKRLPAGLRLFRFANRIPLLYDEANDVSWKVINEEIDWKRYRIPQDAPLTLITHVCSTRIPYKTVGKEYLADRQELERELKNAVREILRRLGTFLSRKGSLEMVKRKMNVYGRYLPLIAKFSTDLAQEKKPPRYRKLLGENTVEEESEEH